jgi:hypothetical protein
MMRHLTLLVVGGCLLAGGASAAEEVALRYRFSAFQGPPVYATGQKLKVGESPAETLLQTPPFCSEKPRYGTVTLGNGSDTTFTFALDESGGTAHGYDRLYLDANNNENLADDPPVSGVRQRGSTRFGPLALLIDTDGRRQLYHAVIERQGAGARAEYYLKSLGYFIGTAPFAAERHAVALIDFNANGIYGDPFRELGPDPSKAGDALLVDANDDGRFEQGSPISKEFIYCGRCIVVDGRFYELQLRPDGSALRVTPAPVTLATIRSGYPRFNLVLAGKEGVWTIESKNGQAQVPAGQYQVLYWNIERQASSGKWEVQGGSMGTAADAPELAVTDRGQASFQLSAPLVAKVTSSRAGSQGYNFQLSVATASGESISNVAVNGGQPPAPTLRVLDDQGNEVAQLKFHYG